LSGAADVAARSVREIDQAKAIGAIPKSICSLDERNFSFLQIYTHVKGFCHI
jgi:hypothetical protein